MAASSYDIFILGAGVAGCATALALKQLDPNLQILIVDRRPNDSPSTLENHRLGETLPPHAAIPLRELGLWNAFQNLCFQRSYGTSAAWGSDELYHNEFILSPNGYGWHIDRNRFDRMLREECMKVGVSIWFASSLPTIPERISGSWKLEIIAEGQKKEVNTHFLVDATGKKASLATRIGASKIKYDRLIGISQVFEESSTETMGIGALVESVPQGWWYSSVLGQSNTVLCFMTDADHARAYRVTTETNYKHFLEQTKFTRERVGSSISKLKVQAAHSQILDRISGDGWLAVGDSATSFDPLSALGVFKALNMSKYASFAILDYLKKNKQGLTRYARIVESEFESYRAKKDEYYHEEERFMEYEFWNRRRQKLVAF